jgi:hypothetical protein
MKKYENFTRAIDYAAYLFYRSVRKSVKFIRCEAAIQNASICGDGLKVLTSQSDIANSIPAR